MLPNEHDSMLYKLCVVVVIIITTTTSFKSCSGFCADSISRLLKKNASVCRAASKNFWTVFSTPVKIIITFKSLFFWV